MSFRISAGPVSGRTATKEKRKAIGMEKALADIKRAAVEIARKVADQYGLMVAGNLCNTWVYAPGDASIRKKTRPQFDAQILCEQKYGTAHCRFMEKE